MASKTEVEVELEEIATAEEKEKEDEEKKQEETKEKDVDEGNVYSSLSNPSEHVYGLPSSIRSHTVNKGQRVSYFVRRELQGLIISKVTRGHRACIVLRSVVIRLYVATVTDERLQSPCARSNPPVVCKCALQ
ncbi:unnamed protein product [Leuciscus chuanchicus]